MGEFSISTPRVFVRVRLIKLSSSSPLLASYRYTANDRIRASPLTGTPVIIALTANADRDTRDLCEEKGESRRLQPPPFALFLSSFSTGTFAYHVYLVGFFAHLVKPLNIPSLHAALRRAFDASQNLKNLAGPAPPPGKTAQGSPVYLEIYLMGEL